MIGNVQRAAKKVREARLYREVKATREDVGKLAEKIDQESDERKAEWAEFYRRAFLGLIGLGGTFLVGFLISRLP